MRVNEKPEKFCAMAPRTTATPLGGLYRPSMERLAQLYTSQLTL